MALSSVQKRINASTGVNRGKVTSQRRRSAKNTFRRKSSGGQGG